MSDEKQTTLSRPLSQPSSNETLIGTEVLMSENQLKTLKDYNILHEIGEGSFSTVFLASTKINNVRCALKICSKRKIQREKKVKQAFRERDNLKLLSTKENQRPFIMTLFATFHDHESLYFVFSYAPNRDVAEKVHKGKFDSDISQFIVAETCLALDYIHSKGILHRDVKPENLLVKEDYHIMLSDFGSSIRIDELNRSDESHPSRKCSFVGSHLYVCPEILNGTQIDETVDYFSVGSILFEMLIGRAPFQDVSEYLVFRRITKNLYTFPDDFTDSNAKDLIEGLLNPKLDKRLGNKTTGGFQTIRDHSYFASIDWTTLAEQPSPFARVFDTLDINEEQTDRLDSWDADTSAN
ncbi:Serine threonine protein kinase-related domain containing protein [Aphelenchoides bicaudatus]|nr:Serine threonine protein kinase-related domain containing protein [Aphelenchoides bicaudatus]